MTDRHRNIFSSPPATLTDMRSWQGAVMRSIRDPDRRRGRWSLTRNSNLSIKGERNKETECGRNERERTHDMGAGREGRGDEEQAMQAEHCRDHLKGGMFGLWKQPVHFSCGFFSHRGK